MLYTLKPRPSSVTFAYFHELYKNTEGITSKVLHSSANGLLCFRVSFNDAVDSR
jgi:hypothetical protein